MSGKAKGCDDDVTSEIRSLIVDKTSDVLKNLRGKNLKRGLLVALY